MSVSAEQFSLYNEFLLNPELSASNCWQVQRPHYGYRVPFRRSLYGLSDDKASLGATEVSSSASVPVASFQIVHSEQRDGNESVDLSNERIHIQKMEMERHTAQVNLDIDLNMPPNEGSILQNEFDVLQPAVEKPVVTSDPPQIVSSQRQENDVNMVMPSEKVFPQQQEIEKHADKEKQGVDLNKTSRKKSRRKKHVPKVVREGQPAKTQRPVIPKPTISKPSRSTKDQPSEKKKGRKRKDLNSSDTPPKVLGEIVNVYSRRGTTFARKALNFGVEDSQAIEKKKGRKRKDLIYSDTPPKVLGEIVNVYSRRGTKFARKTLNFGVEDSQTRDETRGSATEFASNVKAQDGKACGAGTIGSLSTRSIPLRQPSRQEKLRTILSKESRNKCTRIPEILSLSPLPSTPEMIMQERDIKVLNNPVQPTQLSECEQCNLNDFFSKDDSLKIRDIHRISVKADQNCLESNRTSNVLLEQSKSCHNHVDRASVSAYINSMHDCNGTDQVSENRVKTRRKRTKRTRKETKSMHVTFLSEIFKKKRTPNMRSKITSYRYSHISFIMRYVPKIYKKKRTKTKRTKKKTETTSHASCTLEYVPSSGWQMIEVVPNGSQMFSFAKVQMLMTIDCNKLPTPPLSMHSSKDYSQQPQCNSGQEREEEDHGSQTCTKALPSSNLLKVETKRISKDEEVDLANRFSAVTDVMHSHVHEVEYCSIQENQDHPSSSNCKESHQICSQSREIVPFWDPVDKLIQQLSCLRINEGNEGITTQSPNAIVLYGGRSGITTSYEGALVLRKTKRPQAKVDLDSYSIKMWNLLMGKENNFDDGMDMDKEKWEKERQIFRGRVDSFIARMHLIQGNRRFSKWKGSIVDSVIGVFLTQNVTDVLSSSAFMSLAARFPCQPRDNDSTAAAEKISQTIELKDCYVPSDDTCECHRDGVTQLEVNVVVQNKFQKENAQTCSSENTSKQCSHLDDGHTALLQLQAREAEFQVISDRYAAKAHEDHMQNYKTPQSLSKSPNNQRNTSETGAAVETKLEDEAAYHTSKVNKAKVKPKKDDNFDWDNLRKEACRNVAKKERDSATMDSIDYEAVRCADVNEIADAIRDRGMHNQIAGRIKGFLDRMVKYHGSIDLEWLRDVPPDKTKDYLLSIYGLGLKSVECLRLLTLHHSAFPVDTNVGRICVRLGWVPLQPLPESLQLHLLEMYPIMDSIQKYLWPRLCNFDQETLYELHYQMITFGKIYCTKRNPNCNVCPLRGECKHYASAFASSRLALPGPEEKRLVSSTVSISCEQGYSPVGGLMSLPQIEGGMLSQDEIVSRHCEPIIEEPATPEHEDTEVEEIDIEDHFNEDFNFEEFTLNLQNYMQANSMDLQDGAMSKALVAITPKAACEPVHKLKNVSRLRTEHEAYELPDSHPLLEGLERREHDDPCPYLLTIWTPGETAQSTELPQVYCNYQETGKLCDEETCLNCNSVRETEANIVRGTLLIPCRTAMRGSFPLNGTYFQVNEVFADHDSSHKPIDVPRAWIWNLPRRTVYSGTSITSIFRGLTTDEVHNCFWKGFVCVRGFDRTTRAPRPLFLRLHCPPSKAPPKDTRKKASTSKKEGIQPSS